MNIDKISVVIPILNEEKNLINLINEIKKIKRKVRLKRFEVIFVDDNSSDGTKNVIKFLIKKNNFIRYFIRKEKNKDLSKSCILGFKKSYYENIIVMDGDLQHPPRFIEHMSKKFFFNDADIVVGSRNLFNKKNPGLSLPRYYSSVIIIHFINFFLENQTSDPLSGFFIFKKKIYVKNRKKLYAKGYKILADLIYSTDEKLKILDQNIFFDTRKSGKSKMNIDVLIKLVIFILRNFLIKWKKKLLT